MYAYIPALFLAATVAAMPNDIVSRSALSAMKIKEVEQVCDNKQKLVCCDKRNDCEAIEVDG